MCQGNSKLANILHELLHWLTVPLGCEWGDIICSIIVQETSLCPLEKVAGQFLTIYLYPWLCIYRHPWLFPISSAIMRLIVVVISNLKKKRRRKKRRVNWLSQKSFCFSVCSAERHSMPWLALCYFDYYIKKEVIYIRVLWMCLLYLLWGSMNYSNTCWHCIAVESHWYKADYFGLGYVVFRECGKK